MLWAVAAAVFDDDDGVAAAVFAAFGVAAAAAEVLPVSSAGTADTVEVKSLVKVPSKLGR